MLYGYIVHVIFLQR